MRIAFDLDGTLYRSRGMILDGVNASRARLGYDFVGEEQFMRAYQHLQGDWKKLHMRLGIKGEDVPLFVETYYGLVNEQPAMIAGASEAVQAASGMCGAENVHFVTCGRGERARKRLERDGMADYACRLRSSKELDRSKSDLLYEIAASAPGRLVFVGDTISDGVHVKNALRRGLREEVHVDVKFLGIIHPEAMSVPADMARFADANRRFAGIVSGLQELRGAFKRLY